ncbi:ATPase family AAA domain-containing protein 3B [Zalerion maritima]|uniref:ATPase family AAA domain-containing protein 3B n=1 Tax=Zalerion maritima TaxID=339359 RepID=A0AAD5RNE2_9PEZI|nr:ATPase family AAA domain-containing protein 3B [Zalerion maritima]
MVASIGDRARSVSCIHTRREDQFMEMGKEGSLEDGQLVPNLEQRYIQLLENRIADLEKRLSKKGATVDSSDDDSSDSSSSEDLKARKKSKMRRANKRKKKKKKAAKHKAQPPSSTPTDSSQSDAEKTEDKKKKKKKKKKKDGEKEDDTSDREKEDSDKRYKHVLNEYQQKSGQFVDKLAKEVEKKTFEGYAFTFRKYVQTLRSGTWNIYHSELVVHSDAFKKKLGEITKPYLASDKVDQIEFPFVTLVHCWDAAQAYAQEEGSPKEPEEERQTREDWRKMLELVSKSSGNTVITQYFVDRDGLKGSGMTTFEYLWTLFPRGAFVVSKPFEGQPQIFLVEGCENPPRQLETTGTRKPFKVLCFAYDWSGVRFIRVPYQLEIEPFADKKAISELPVYPLENHEADNLQAFRSELIQRGSRYVEFVTRESGKQMFRYEGAGYHRKGTGLFYKANDGDRDDEDGMQGHRRFFEREKEQCLKINVKGLVVIDFKSYFAYQDPQAPTIGDLKRDSRPMPCSCTDCQRKFEHLYRFKWDESKPSDRLDDDQYLCLPPRVLGYALEHKRWVQLSLNKLMEPDKADSTNFTEKLQLEGEAKDIIRDSVMAHSMNKTRNIDDYTPGKGKGLVILLWGIPGVGKTLTAESVAAMAGKPLFSVGVSDIGIEGSKVEVNLQNVFDLAGLWQAVLLFDEADVFLENRDATKADIQRNTIVSVLLRVLEYYEGILILTTNRLKSFDIAVQSRIHIAIQYKDLAEGQRLKIFIDFLKQLHDKNSVDNWEKVKDWVTEDGCAARFNGRQIRNIVSTAMAIANANSRPLKMEDLKLVAKHVKKFIEVLFEREIKYRQLQAEDPYQRQ